MKSFKLTPLIVFLILLIVLAISIYMRNSYFVEGIENMFNDKGQFSEFILPEYSNNAPLTQLTETIFYDKKNGNIVEAVVEWTSTTNGTDIGDVPTEPTDGDEPTVPTDGDEPTVPTDGAKPTVPTDGAKPTDGDDGAKPTDGDDGAKPTDGDDGADETFTNIEGHETMGSQTPTLKTLIITPRNGADSYMYDITKTVECVKKPTQESLVDEVDSTCGSWSYVSQSEFAPETTILYMPWKNETYLSVFENSDGKMIPKGIFHFSKEKNSVVDVKAVEITNYINTQDDNNNKYVQDEKYGEHDLYQVDKFVLYDIPTSNLIVRKEHNTGSINIYNGVGETITTDKVKEIYDANKTHENQEKYAELKAWTTLDGQGENIIIYIKNVDKTLVAVCGFESSTMDSLVLKNVKRFTLYGMDNCDKIEKPTPSACDKKASEASSVKETETKVSEPASDDYILKTQIVPPVCPSCPMCPKDVTCTNCGGNGGCGTKGTDGKSMVKDEKTVTKVVDENGNVISETVGEVTDLARDTASGAVDLAKDTASGTVGLGREIIGGAVGLGREIVGGATGLVQDVTGGATGLLRDAGSGAVQILTPEQQRQQQLGNGTSTGRMAIQQSSGNQGAYYGTNNNFSRYGALPEKQSNFMPRTADFSSFA